MQPTKSLIIGASLGALMNLAVTSGAEAKADDQSAKETAREIKALREQIDALQRKVDAQAASEQLAKDQAAAASAQAASAAASANAAAVSAASIPAQVQTAVAAAAPKTDAIYYKGVKLTLGGFVEAASIYRQHDQNNDISSAYNAIPFASTSVAHTNQFLETARQSRFSALVQGSPNDVTHLGFYTEFDLQGAAQTANSRESNSYNPRLRVLYGTMDWDTPGLHFTAGQAWSLVTLTKQGLVAGTEATPPTIDGQYMPGFTWARQPQVRITKDFDKQIWLGLSIENPQSSFYQGPNAYAKTVVDPVYQVAGTGLGYNSGVNNSLNRLPDVVAKVAADENVGIPVHVEAYGLYSNFYQRLNYGNQNVNGGGVGAGLFTSVVPGFLDLQVSGLAGRGIGRYGSGQLSEVTFDAGGNLQPIHEVIALAGLTLHAMPTLDLYFYAGQDRESAEAFDVTSSTGTVTGYGIGNALYNNSGCTTESPSGTAASGTCIGNEHFVEQATTGFWHKPYVGSYGTIRWGVQYSHTEFKAFEGKGGAPTVIQNMVFASFRYYPYTDK